MMNDYRSILAVLCAGAGLFLIVISIRKSAAGAKKSTALTWVYAFLFFAVALILWTRQEGDELTVTSPPVRETPPVVDSVTRDSLSVPPEKINPAKPLSLSPRANLPVVETSESELQRSGASGVASVTPESVSEPSVHRPGKEPRTREESETGGDRTESVDWNPDEVQDGIYHAVDGAFGWITRFFEKHGSTARSQNVVTRREPARATGHKPLPAFPAVTFYTGTAELTGVSQAGLETLAAEFSAQPDLGVLEVQARVDSLGPEAFNYILTEARAAAVRDFLISAGVPAERIQARGVGSSVLDAPKENSDVQFVVRR